MTKTLRYRGKLHLADYGESMDVLFLGGGEPLAASVSDDIEENGRYLSVRYWTADEAQDDDAIAEGAVRRMLGEGDVQFSPRYSGITGYLWTDEDLNVGGHDLLSELGTQAGRYCLLEIAYSDTPVSDAPGTAQ